MFPSTATSLELHETGGRLVEPAAGSTCAPGDDSYTYVLATHALSWTECTSPTPNGVYAFVPGQATLDDIASYSATLVFETPGGDTTFDAAEYLGGYDNMTNAIYAATQ